MQRLHLLDHRTQVKKSARASDGRLFGAFA